MTKRAKSCIKLSCAAGGLGLTLILLLTLRTLSDSFADFWTRYIAGPPVWAASHFTSLFPFPVFEVLVFLLIATVLFLIVLSIVLLVKKNFASFLKGLLIVAVAALSLGNYYALTAGFAYYRPPVPVPQSEREYENADVAEMTEWFLDDYNDLAQKLERDESGNVKPPYTPKELSDKIAAEYGRIGDDYYFSYTPRAKVMANSWFMTLTAVTGITLMPLGEPVVNGEIPKSELPQTMAHEMAHAKGVMREGDCNFVSYYVLLSSGDDYLRYCGYFAAFPYLISAVDSGRPTNENYKRLTEKISPLIRREQTNAHRFWTEKTSRPGPAGTFARFFEKVGNFFNDLYLKLNGADNGTGSYGDTAGDGSITDTGDTDPETGLPVYEVTYSSLQKMFFSLYENAPYKTYKQSPSLANFNHKLSVSS